MKEGGKPVFPEKTLDDELQKCHTLKPKNSNPLPRLEPILWHW